MTETRTCKGCGEAKPLSAFPPHPKCRDGIRPYCNDPCWKAEKAASYQRHKAKHAHKLKAYRVANKERLKGYFAAYYQRNKDKRAVYREENRERERAKRAARDKINRKRLNAAVNAWYAAHPEAKRAHRENYRARKLSAPGTHTATDILEILEAQRWRCAYCRRSLRARYQIDHIVPLMLGGPNSRNNLQATCVGCNGKKSDKPPEEFARTLGLLI